MSDALELCIGDSHIVPDVFLLNILAMDSMLKKSKIFAQVTLHIPLNAQN